MDHQTRMRVANRLQDLEKQFEAFVDRQLVGRAILIDRHAFDIFEREVGLTIRRDPRVVETRDVGVFEAGENVALLRHALCQRADPTHMGPLQCNAALQGTVGSFGEPDAAHAPRAERPNQAVSAHEHIGTIDRFVRRGIGEVNERRAIQRTRRLIVGLQQRREFSAQSGVVPAREAKPEFALLRRHGRQFGKQVGRPFPSICLHHACE